MPCNARAANALLLTLAVSAWGLSGCASGASQEPELLTGPDAEVTADGLHRLVNSGFAHAWAKQGIEFADYKTIMLAPPRVAYKRTPRKRSGSMMNANYALSDDQMVKFKELISEAFVKEFDKSQYYELVDTPGPDTLLIENAIIDLVILVPTQSSSARESTFTTSTALMTLVMELRDARSGEILARIAERREARAPGSNGTTTLTWSNTVNDVAAIRSTFRRWARILRERLDRVQALAPTGEEPNPEL